MSVNVPVIILSLKVAFAALVFILPIGSFFGWLLARKDFPGKSFVDALINIPLALPPVVTGYCLLIIFGPGSSIGRFFDRIGFPIAFTWMAAVLAAAVVSMPLLTRAVRVAVESVDPKIEDAARMLRAGEIDIFFKITLPLSKHGIISGAVLSFGRAIGEFGATIVFAGNIQGETQTIPLAIFSYLNQVDGEARAKVLILIAIVIAYLSIALNEWMLRKVRDAQN